MAAETKARFALQSLQAGLTFDDLAERAQACERLGYHSLWLADHFWHTRSRTDAQRQGNYLEATATMAALLARTQRLRIGSLVLSNPYRNPALLAKILSSLDHIGRGRLEIGIGAGWFEQEFHAYGYEFEPISLRLKQLEESLRILKLMFVRDGATFDGRHYRLSGAYNNPKPVQRPHPPITIGGSGEKVLLRLVAQFADRWNYPGAMEDFDRLLTILKSHCAAVGRDFNQITVSHWVLICMGRDQREVERRWREAQDSPYARTAIKGTPDQIITLLRHQMAQGVRLFHVYFTSDVLENLEYFAREVIPAFV